MDYRCNQRDLNFQLKFARAIFHRAILEFRTMPINGRRWIFNWKKKNVRYRAAFASNYALDDNATQFGSVESRHTVISDNGPKRWDSSVVSQETRRCGANLTLVHRKRRRFLRGDRRSRYIIARLVVSSGARGDIQPLAAVKPSSHDPRFPPPGPLPPNILFPRASWTYVTTPVTPRRHTRRAHAVPYSFLAVTRWYLVFFDSAAAFACD